MRDPDLCEVGNDVAVGQKLAVADRHGRPEAPIRPDLVDRPGRPIEDLLRAEIGTVPCLDLQRLRPAQFIDGRWRARVGDGLWLRRRRFVVGEAGRRQRQVLDLWARPDRRIGHPQQREAGRQSGEQAAMRLDRLDRRGCFDGNRAGRMADPLHVAVAVSLMEKRKEAVVLPRAKGRAGRQPLIDGVHAAAARETHMHADRLGDASATVVPKCPAFVSRRREGYELGGNAESNAHGAVAQHRPADLLAFLQGLRDQLDGLIRRQRFGGRMALGLLPGLGGVAHRGAEFAPEDGLEMAGPYQGLADVGRRDEIRRRRAVPPVLEDAAALLSAACRRDQRRQADRRQATKGSEVRQKGARKEGRHNNLSRLS